VGTPLVSVLGPSDPALWRAWGPGVRLVQPARRDGATDRGDTAEAAAGRWPTVEQVDEAVAQALAGPAAPPRG
jgi:heptosyltransferase-2